MIRVIYRWQVPPENLAAFQRVWRATTNSIHASVAGALGSFMLRACDAESEVLTVARWESLESWQRFWGDRNPEAMQSMRDLGKRISVEVFEEVEDHTR